MRVTVPNYQDWPMVSILKELVATDERIIGSSKSLITNAWAVTCVVSKLAAQDTSISCSPLA